MVIVPIRRSIQWLSLSLLLAMTVAGCSGGNFSKRTNAETQSRFRYAIHASPTTLDPGLVQDVDTSDLLQNVYEGLFSYNDKNEITPQLADSYTLEEGGKTYVIKLRDAKFHDGTPLTAQDVKFSIQRHAKPDFGSPTAASYLTDIVGFQDFVAGKSKEITGIQVVDDRTVKISIDKPRPYFLGKLTYPCAFVVPAKTAGNKEITDTKLAVGTGPFKLTRYDKEQQVTLDANADYYLGAPKVSQLIRPVIKDASTRLLKYRNGELDFLTLERQDIAAVESDSNLKAEVKEIPRPAIYYLGLNQSQYAPFKDVRVRKAFAMAIDRNKIAEEIIRLPVAKGFIPPGIPGARPDLAGIPFDPSQARKLLAEAGYPNGRGLPPLTITYREGRPDSQLLAVAAVTDLKKNLSVEVTTRALEWRTFLEARNAKKLPFVGLSWYADYLDPENFLSFLLTTKAGENRDGYSNPEFDRLCAAADTESDPQKRIALYHQAEDLLIKDAARIPAYFGRDIVLVKPHVIGLKVNLFGTMPHTVVEVKSEKP